MIARHPIRPAKECELVLLQDIERSAGSLFAQIGMTEVADDDPPSIDVLMEFASDGRAWVCTDSADRPVAYLLADLVDANAHLEQISVHRDSMHRGIGSALLAHMGGWARARELPAITLTTFTEVPWNGPYYESRGFRYVPKDEETPGLRAIRAAEFVHGLDRFPRACMRREL